MASAVEPFGYDGEHVDPGESEKLRFAVSNAYLSDPVRASVPIGNGAEPDPTCIATQSSSRVALFRTLRSSLVGALRNSPTDSFGREGLALTLDL